MLSCNHCSIEMRAIGLVAHVNAKSGDDRRACSDDGRDDREPATAADHPNQESAPDREGHELKQRSGAGRERDRSTRPGHDCAHCGRQLWAADREAEDEPGRDQRQARGDRNVLEVDVGEPEPQWRCQGQRPGKGSREPRSKRQRQGEREGGDGDDREDQVGDPLIGVRHRIVGLKEGRRAGGDAMEQVRELLQEDTVELGCALSPTRRPAGASTTDPPTRASRVACVS